uniref:Ribosomal biogenesis protein LAS1L n=1 Tax=Cacopsylla melanoneura TaxID=428564 RepID=A0A8D8PT39_9HEMI
MTSDNTDADYTHVPWYSMEEWNLVYRLVYSSNIEDMKKAYRWLLIWKTRVEHLPAGVECTLGVLQVRLREMELATLCQSIILNEDLQLMYSTAIIRFLNMIAELEQGRPSTLYSKAQGMAIPSWIVNLRHDAAHSSVLPPLHSLKSAADFIFTWLNDYYWKNEAEHTFDYFVQVIPSEGCYKRNVRQIISLVNIYVQIVSEQKEHLSEDVKENLLNLIPTLNSSQKKEDISNRLLTELSKKTNKESRKQDILVAIVEETELLSRSQENNNNCTRSDLLSLWTPILNVLNKHQLLIDLLKLLVEVLDQHDEARSKQAAWWIDAICKGFSKLERCLHIKLDLIKRKVGTDLPPKDMFKLILKVADKTYSKLKHAPVLKGKLPHGSEFKEVLEEALKNPSQHTSIFIDSLCFISRVPKPPILQLVNIYTNNLKDMPDDRSQLTRVFTLDYLMQRKETDPAGKVSESRVTSDEEAEMMDVDEKLSPREKASSNIWRLADDLDWLHCPLGCVPGKPDVHFLDFDLLAREDGV